MANNGYHSRVVHTHSIAVFNGLLIAYSPNSISLSLIKNTNVPDCCHIIRQIKYANYGVIISCEEPRGVCWFVLTNEIPFMQLE